MAKKDPTTEFSKWFRQHVKESFGFDLGSAQSSKFAETMAGLQSIYGKGKKKVVSPKDIQNKVIFDYRSQESTPKPSKGSKKSTKKEPSATNQYDVEKTKISEEGKTKRRETSKTIAELNLEAINKKKEIAEIKSKTAADTQTQINMRVKARKAERAARATASYKIGMKKTVLQGIPAVFSGLRRGH